MNELDPLVLPAVFIEMLGLPLLILLLTISLIFGLGLVGTTLVLYSLLGWSRALR